MCLQDSEQRLKEIENEKFCSAKQEQMKSRHHCALLYKNRILKFNMVQEVPQKIARAIWDNK